ncbi:MAG: DUF3306 domain-containing protein [Rhodobacteraceae bacterium]|nr:DUF3306 domain-containing protein [Paracoccaceae bacterium]
MSRNFWSERRAAVAREEAEDERRAEAERAAERERALAERSDEDILEELQLPDPDTLEAGDDFKAFMTDAVPQRIKTRALRRLWLSNPALANIDGLVDYGEDFTDAATVVENLATAYQVGKGMTAHVEEMARQAERQAEAATEDGDITPADPEQADDTEDSNVEEPAIVAEAPTAPRPEAALISAEQADANEDQTVFEAPRPPRMRVTFERGVEA